MSGVATHRCPHCGGGLSWPQPSATGLTKAQRDTLSFIKAHIEDNRGIPPSFDDMAKFLGLKSKSGVHRIICALEERGHISRLPNRARAITLREAVSQ